MTEHSRPCVLLVEDDPDSRALLSEYLELEGFSVVLAADGRDALRFAGERRVDVVVLDLGLPDMAGMDVARALQALPSDAPLPIIALSGRTVSRTELLEGTFAARLPKPVEPSLLAAQIRRYLRTHRSSD
jgi:DNA-binding response OmpR family regulator